MGKLLDIATESEVKKYFGSVIVNNNTLDMNEKEESNNEMTAGGSNFII